MTYAIFDSSTASHFILVNCMALRGRPAKILSQSDLEELLAFLQKLPFLKKNEQCALQLLQLGNGNFDAQQLNILKSVDRQRIQYQQRYVLLEQLKLKASNQQKLLENEAEILALSAQDLDQDTFFRLDRALESYQKIQKAVLNDRIRLENERRRDVLNKSGKSISDAQKRRNEENRRKYEMGGAVMAAFKKLGIDISADTPDQVKNRIVNNGQFAIKVKRSKIFTEISEHQKDFFKKQNLFIDVLQGLSAYHMKEKHLSTIEIEKHKSKYEN